jgi:E3 ubiquitin-protein ligase HUWE1
VSLISLPVEKNALNAAVRLCVRLTRDSHLAQVFVEAGGPHHILELKRSSTFDGFAMLLTLLLRHVLEDRDTLRHTMEKVIRSAVVSGIGSSKSGVGSNSLGTKEFNYLLRVLSPVAARQPEIFKELLLKSMRFTLPAQMKRGGQPGNEVTIPPNQALLVNTIPTGKPPKIPKVSESVRGVVYELLNSLCKDPEETKADDSAATEELPCDSQGSGPSQSQVGRTLGELGDLLDGRPTPSLVRHLTGESLPSEDIEDMIIGRSPPFKQKTVFVDFSLICFRTPDISYFYIKFLHSCSAF